MPMKNSIEYIVATQHPHQPVVPLKQAGWARLPPVTFTRPTIGTSLVNSLTLPRLVGAVSFLVIAVAAGMLLRDGLLAYALLGCGGLLGIHLFGTRHRTRLDSGRLSQEQISLVSALHSLAQISESRDRELAGHSERVAENSVAIGREIGLDEEQLEQLWWAGLLHDVGKLGLSESILQKPGPLTEAERFEVRKHPEYGAEIVSPFCRAYPSISDAIRFHHERWDGRGYPSGLSGQQIPVLARIVAVADVFEALTSSRTYRMALTAEQAAIYINNEGGQHFDPSVVRAFNAQYRLGSLRVAEANDVAARSSFRSAQGLITTQVG